MGKKFFLKIGVSLFLLVLSGCSVGGDYQKVEVELPSGWQDKSSDLAGGGLTDGLLKYWERLGDDKLNLLIEKLVESNLSIKQAFLRAEEARELYRVQAGEFGPDIDFSATARTRRRSEAVASAIANPRNDFYSVGGVMSWELDLLGRLRRLSQAAWNNAEASKEEYRALFVTLHAEVANAYISYRTLQEQIKNAEENLRIQKESLQIAQDLFASGVVPELDVRQAESNLGNTEASLPLLRISLANQLNRISVLLGTYPQEVKELIGTYQDVPALPNISSQNLPLAILRQRPDIRQAERLLAAEHERIGASEAELYPIITLPGEIAFQALDNASELADAGSLAFSIGPDIRWNILDFGRVRGRVRVQELRRDRAFEAYKQTVFQAVREVEDAMVSLKEQKLRVASLEKSVRASRKSAALVRSLYVSGLTDFQNVLDSERVRFEQEISLAQSRGDVVNAYIALFRSLGGGWMEYLEEEKF